MSFNVYETQIYKIIVSERIAYLCVCSNDAMDSTTMKIIGKKENREKDEIFVSNGTLLFFFSCFRDNFIVTLATCIGLYRFTAFLASFRAHGYFVSSIFCANFSTSHA